MPQRRFAIGDIHGCRHTMEVLIEEILLPTKEDEIIFLGDYLHRGPDSLGVIRYIIEHQNQGYNWVALRGNHEEMVIESSQYGMLSAGFPEDRRVLEEFPEFLEGLHYYYETPGWICVHAGLNFNAPEPLEDYSSLLWIRNFVADPRYLQGRRIVHGHNPTGFNVIREQIRKQADAIPLDNGCVFAQRFGTNGERYDMGHLCALNLDTDELHYQEYLG